MRLHRLVLANYRGITHREIEFPECGITVVIGPNEVGKSSMIEALDLLLGSKDRSAKKDVKQVKPTHADVGSEITAEISTGKYRFLYRKRFHKQSETELTILAPAREQLTGDEAHDRVRAIIDETVDPGLWQAQRVLQAASTSAVELSSCDALSRALDVAAADSAGLSAGLSGGEPLLIDKIDAEYARYFTATGRRTGEWATVNNRLRDAEAEVVRCEAAVAEVDERVQTHAVLTDELAGLAGQRDAVRNRHAAAEAAAAAVAALADEVRAAGAEATAATATGSAADVAHQERIRLSADVDVRRAAAEAADIAAAESAQSEKASRDVVAEAEGAVAQAAERLSEAHSEAERAGSVVAQIAERDEAARLAARLARIDAAQVEVGEVEGRLAGIRLTEDMFRRIEVAAGAAQVVQAQVDLTSSTVEFSAESDIELVVGDDPIALSAGEVWALTAAEVTAVRLPGMLTVRVSPGATAVELQTKLAAAQQQLAEALTEGAVPDVEQGRLTDRRRRDLTARHDQLQATLAGMRGDDDIDELRVRLAGLRASRCEITLDSEVARADYAAAKVALAEATARCDTMHKVAAAAAARLVERSTRATVAREKAVTARTEFAVVADRLAAQRAVVSDDALSVRAQNTAREALLAQERVWMLAAKLADASPDTVEAELAAARSAADTFGRRHDEAAQALRDVTVELAVFGTEGRTGKLDAAQITREHAAAEFDRVRARAHAVQLLREVMTRHRDNTRLRYVEPFRAEVERLGRTVFGPTFEVEVDGDLQIRNRTLNGCTVSYESLSGGAREQLGIVARMAVAALVAKEDTVPVMIDDALGFSDPDRLARMGEMFELAGADGQVIVLTCSPERYSGIRSAHRVWLTA
jgi:recombinational DNA repair ATPase RecF